LDFVGYDLELGFIEGKEDNILISNKYFLIG